MAVDPHISATLDEHARLLSEIMRRLEAQDFSAQEEFRSQEGGTKEIYDNEGNLRQILGEQDDGTYTVIDVNAPAPAAPSAPILKALPGVLVITWDGTTFDDSPIPFDFDGVAVHSSTTPGYEATDITELHTFKTAKGGSVTFAMDEVPHFIKLVMYNTSGAESAYSIEVEGTPLPAATGSGGVKTYATDTEPLGLGEDDEGALWLRGTDGRLHRWDGTTWVQHQDADIATAIQDAEAARQAAATADAKAVAAQDAAATAQQKAEDAEQEALNALGVAQDKSDIVYQTTAPAGDPNVYWVNTSTGRGHRWDGANWIEIQDESVQTALSDAAAAQSAADAAQSDANVAQSSADAAQQAAMDAQATADGKIVTFYAPDDAPPVAEGVGDYWSVEGMGNLTRRWDGTGWVDLPSGKGAIDTAAVGRGEVEFNASSGMLSTIVPDPRFMDPALRNIRLSRDFGLGWDIVPVENLLSSNDADWTLNTARATSFTILPGEEYEGALSIVVQASGIQSGEDLIVSNTFPVTENITYGTLALSNNADVTLQYQIDFMDSSNVVIATYTCDTSSGGFDHGAPVGSTQGRIRVIGGDSIATSYTGEAALYGVSTWYGGRDAKVGHYYATYEAQSLDNSSAWLAKNMPVEEEQELYLEIILRPRTGNAPVQLNYMSWYSMAEGRGAAEHFEIFYDTQDPDNWERLTTSITVPHGTQSMDAGVVAIPTAVGQGVDVAQITLYPRGYRSKDGSTVAIFDPDRFEFDHRYVSLTATAGPQGISAGEIVARVADGVSFARYMKLSRDGMQVSEPWTIIAEDWHVVGTPGEPAYENGWADNPNGEGTYFKKDAAGNIWIAFNVSVPANAQSTRMFQLPEGYRPGKQISSALFWQNTSGPRFGTANVLTDGSIVMFHAGNGWGTVAVGNIPCPK